MSTSSVKQQASRNLLSILILSALDSNAFAMPDQTCLKCVCEPICCIYGCLHFFSEIL